MNIDDNEEAEELMNEEKKSGTQIDYFLRIKF